MSVSTKVDRWEEITDWKNKLQPFSCSICPSAKVLNVHKVQNLPLIVQDKKAWEYSLIGHPYDRPVFDCLQYTKTEVLRLTMQVMSMLTYTRQRREEVGKSNVVVAEWTITWHSHDKYTIVLFPCLRHIIMRDAGRNGWRKSLGRRLWGSHERSDHMHKTW